MSAVSAVDNSTLINSYITQQEATAKAAAAKATDSKSALMGNYDTFLKILTTQLKNQDPTSPMDASEFTNQLVQYSTVEQQIASNDKLDSILTALNSNGITPLLSYVGRYTESTADGKLVVQGGQSMLAYDLPSTATNVTLSVQDSKGNVIAKIDGTTTKGLNRIAWDGKLDSGEQAADGVYKFVLAAKDSTGAAIELDDVRVIGMVTGIETASDGTTTLKLGDLSVSDTNIKSVFASVGTSGSGSPSTNTNSSSSEDISTEEDPPTTSA
ncbi:MAG: flagellar hook assembly protein FlgD [Proteobacteria bacterium]|jgi:flagellar basal-body rod modification protein FlgD|nr:flagellar hook capping FlgD N-terminal domain-containing protein [Alphaproteobacteria bacterium]NCC03524.1 flagellar hook assembly protein FlgD [Pseudomonadota bacterium]